MGLYFLNYKIYMSPKTYMSWTLGLTTELSSPWASCCHGPCIFTAGMVQFLCIFFKVQIPIPFTGIYLLELGQGHIKKHWEEYCVKRPLKIGFLFTCSGIEFEYLHELTQYVLFTLILYQQLVLLLMIFSVGFSLCSSWVSYFGIMILVLWWISKVM